MENPKRIAIYLPSLEVGGAEVVLLNLANSLSTHGYDVVLLIHFPDGPLSRKVAGSIRIICLQSPRFLLSIFELSRLYKILDLHVLLTSVYSTGIVAILANMIASQKITIITSAHNSIKQKQRNPDNHKDRLSFWLLKYLLRFSDGIISVSYGVAAELASYARIPHKKIFTIYNPVLSEADSNVLVQLENAPIAERNIVRIVTVGRLVKQKSLDVLLTALSHIGNRLSYELLIIGDGPERHRLDLLADQLCISENIFFLGTKDNPLDYMASADIYVVSSSWDGLNTTLVEALSLGIKIIATDADYGAREILLNGFLGSLVPVNEPLILADEIVRQSTTPPLDSNIRAYMKQHANNFKIEVSARQYKAVFEYIYTKKTMPKRKNANK